MLPDGIEKLRMFCNSLAAPGYSKAFHLTDASMEEGEAE